MSAVFLRKKQWWYIALSQILAAIIGVCMCYAVMLNYANAVWLGKSFYFLVSGNTHVDAGTHETRLNGGAGYLLEYEGNAYVAWSVYFNEADGLAVQTGILEPSKLVKRGVSYLYFKKRADKKNRKIIEGALNSFYGCMDVLSQGVSMLDQGLTQQSCKRLLTLLNKEYAYMGEVYRECYPSFSIVCETMKTMLSDILNKPIYGKDLRYLLCSACDAYIRLASVFSL